jgi:hypothetical protein
MIHAAGKCLGSLVAAAAVVRSRRRSGPRSGTSTRHTERMDALAAALLIVLLAVPLLIVGVMFVWAAKRDGEEDRAIQRRLGIRRKTRLGR